MGAGSRAGIVAQPEERYFLVLEPRLLAAPLIRSKPYPTWKTPRLISMPGSVWQH